MNKRNLLKILSVAGIGLVPVSAMAQDNSWLLDLQNPQCSAESRQSIADGVRQQIEDSVARATAAIQPPAALGDLSCLNDLMNVPLDSFSNIGGLVGNLQGGLSGGIGDPGDGLSRKVCEFAAEKWGDVTEPLSGRMSELSGAGSDIWSNFDLVNNGDAPTSRPPSGSGSSGDDSNSPLDPNSGWNDGGDYSDPPPEELPVSADCTPLLQMLQLCQAPSQPTEPPAWDDGFQGGRN